MKELLLTVFFLPALAFGQFKEDAEKNLYFEKVYQVEMDAPVIREKVFEWVATNFNDTEKVIQMNTENKIVVNGRLDNSLTVMNVPVSAHLKFIMSTEFREGRYKVLINNLQQNVEGHG